jgi:hypothetical protein
LGEVIRLALVVSAAAVLLMSGCGGPPQSSTPAGTPISAPASPSPQTPVTAAVPASTTGTLQVAQQGDTPASMVWYLRVEDLAAKPLMERAYYGQPIAFSQAFPAAGYRIVVWSRPCDGACPVSGEAGLGPLKQVCGAKLELTAGVETNATAVLTTDGGCTVRVGT